METLMSILLVLSHILMLVLWFMLGKFSERLRAMREMRDFLSELSPRIHEIESKMRGKEFQDAVDMLIRFDLDNIERMSEIIYPKSFSSIARSLKSYWRNKK